MSRDTPNWSQASLPVWALVSGLPSGQREKRPLLMLQAFIDDSGTDGRSPVFVLAGFISTVERWAAFTDEWTESLRWAGIEYFKMNEAATLTGQFLHWSEANRDEKVVRFHRIIEEHVIHAVSLRLILSDLEYVIGHRPEAFLKNPYYWSFWEIMTQMRRNAHKFGLNKEIDFVFDQQLIEKGKLADAWDAVTAQSRGNLQTDFPGFRSSKAVKPLQAADMIAWWIRREVEKDQFGIDGLTPPWQSKVNIPLVNIFMDRNRLERLSRLFESVPIRSFSFGPWKYPAV